MGHHPVETKQSPLKRIVNSRIFLLSRHRNRSTGCPIMGFAFTILNSK